MRTFVPGITALALAVAAFGLAAPAAAAQPATIQPTTAQPATTQPATATPASASATAAADTAAPLASGTTRLAGADRYATAVAISRQFTAGVPVVYVASGANFPDALSSASAAALQQGPLLLTAPNVLPTTVREEIVRLAPARIVVSGGTGAVSQAVYQQLAELAPEIRRDFGTDRYKTSLAVNAAAFAGTTSSVAFLSAGSNYPDALSASAAAGGRGAPVILVNGAAPTIDGATSALLTSIGVTTLYLTGGTGAISTGVENSAKSLLGAANVIRLSGADRYATSNAINRALFSSAPTAYIASGAGFADGLAGAALAGRDHAPLFVSAAACVPDATGATLQQLGTTNRVLLGGAASLSGAVENGTACSALTPPPVTPPVTPPPGPTKPANPGDTKNCGDFTTWAAAQAWFLKYYPYYGDVARLDQDNDGIACESLPGAP